MFPLQPSFPHMPNKMQTEGGNNPGAQQVIMPNPCLTNSNNLLGNPLAHQFPCSSCACHNQLAFRNPQCPMPFNNLTTHLNNLNGNVVAMPNGSPMVPSPCLINGVNHCFPVQNSHLGMPTFGSPSPYQHLAQSHGQLFPQNAPHNFNPIAASPLRGHPSSNLPQNLNQMAPSQPHGQLFMHNNPQFVSQIMPMRPYAAATIPGGGPCPQIPQHLNPLAGFPQNQMQNVNQHAPMQCSQNSVNPIQVSHDLPLCSNASLGQMSQATQILGNQNPTFLMNPQLGMMNPCEVAQQNKQDHLSGPPTIGQNCLQETPIASQHLQGISSLACGLAQQQQSQMNLQSVNLQKSQGNHAKGRENHIPNTIQGNPESKNFRRNYHESWKRDSAHPKFQKSSNHPMATAKGNFRTFNRQRGKGSGNEGVRKSHPANSTKQAKVECKRFIPLNYTEQEIQQWREARKRNYPSRANIEKKLTEKAENAEVTDRDAKAFRQQLKEILAKQAELGVEVAEIPPEYLSEPDRQVCEGEEDKKVFAKKGRLRNHGKRGRYGQDRRFAKKQKLEGKDLSNKPALKMSKPTLLQKLLSADIKRDKSHLLQVFRFMVLNSFFKNCPDKPLEFPSVIVKDMVSEKEVIEKPSHQTNDDLLVSKNSIIQELQGTNDQLADNGDDGDGSSDDDGKHDVEVENMAYKHVGKRDCAREELEKSEAEEGEIID
ncbi:PREDICTED: uncharacterized protein LOC104612482 [Nelumbo nucifera]|uniref:FMR1-interacting protein 1 conserved domain-containing protein n=2 Tax=Nelumbo nucifera TaxID=4432 RepID=A0A822Y8Y9_NELNU|nr:PREDICTED: uncharacterized protein LOC104612482 [Nelumbo nucifera]DAD28732.1 TPA_asm: hypothetical protein HUJ06_030200 [Nelumbo nucifera]